MRTYRDILERDGAMLRARSEQTQTHISSSLAEQESVPVTVRVFQMRSQCGGEAGEKENLGRMLDAVGVAGSGTAERSSAWLRPTMPAAAGVSAHASTVPNTSMAASFHARIFARSSSMPRTIWNPSARTA